MNPSVSYKLKQQLVGIIPLLVILFVFLTLDSLMGQPAVQFPTGEGEESIKIGVLITADTAGNPLTKQAVDVIQLAIDRHNRSGGIRGKKVEALVKSVEGRWGTGSKRSVSLIFEDQVSAILGFVGGRSAHLIEQVCTKAEVPFISTFSPDPTLSRSNIPWYFSSMPHAGQQAELLANEIYLIRRMKNITIIVSDDYDVQYLKRSFLRKTEQKSFPQPRVLTYHSGNTDFSAIMSKLTTSATEGVVFLGNTPEWGSLIPRLEHDDFNTPVYTPIMQFDSDLPSSFSVPVFGILPQYENTAEKKSFMKEFYQTYQYRPGNYAYPIYDGVTALLESIKLNGERRAEIKEGLREITSHGTVLFDSSGVIKSGLAVKKLN